MTHVKLFKSKTGRTGLSVLAAVIITIGVVAAAFMVQKNIVHITGRPPTLDLSYSGDCNENGTITLDAVVGPGQESLHKSCVITNESETPVVPVIASIASSGDFCDVLVLHVGDTSQELPGAKPVNAPSWDNFDLGQGNLGVGSSFTLEYWVSGDSSMDGSYSGTTCTADVSIGVKLGS